MLFKRWGTASANRKKVGRQIGRRVRRFEKLEDRRVLAGMPTVDVLATVETENISSADDPAIWIHPTDSSLSRIIATNKNSSNGLITYDLSGNETQVVHAGATNNVDVRYGFSLGGGLIDIAAAGNRSDNSIVIYKVDPGTGQLEDIAARTIRSGISVYGFGMYHSQATGKFYAFVNSKSGAVEQWELFDNGNGQIDAELRRTFDVGSQVEGIVADDELGQLYIGEEDVGIWKYNAKPDAGTGRELVDTTNAGGNLTADVEGLTIYYAGNGDGYLIASSQGSNEFVIYGREDGNDYVGTFKITAGNGIDAVTDTDGIDVTSVPLGTAFPQGAFIAQDNDVNYKLVPWQSIAQSFPVDLNIDTNWDPRGDVDPPPVDPPPVDPPPINQPPIVSAGSDQTVVITQPASLDGIVSDDGLPNPPGQRDTQWSRISGPGDVDFANPFAPATTATFSQPGTYLLQLTVGDGQLWASDTMTVTVDPLPNESITAVFQDGNNGYQGTADTYLRSNSPNRASGSRSVMKFDGVPDSAALIRWDVATLPVGSQVTAATITLNVANPSHQDYFIYELLQQWSETDATWNQAADGVDWQTSGAQDNQDRGSTSLGTVSPKSTGKLTVSLNAAGLAVVQGWIDNPAGNHGLIIQRYEFVDDGTTISSSESSNPSKRPRLEISYATGGEIDPPLVDPPLVDPPPVDPPPVDPPPINQPPIVSAGSDQAMLISESVALEGSVSDDGHPEPRAQLNIDWSLVSGPGNVEFANAYAASTTATFSQPGTYTLRLSANDSQLGASDTMTVIVNPLPFNAITAVFQDGVNDYQGTSDTYLRSNSENRGSGNRSVMKFDGMPDSTALVRWDISALPSGAQVTAATLTLNVLNQSLHEYHLYELLQDWSETNATWNQAADGIDWQSSGAMGIQDRGSTSLGTVAAISTGKLTVHLNAAGLAVVQGWIDDPTTNHGLTIQGDELTDDGTTISSSESSNPANRPRLEIRYATNDPVDPPPTPDVGLVGYWKFETAGPELPDTSTVNNAGVVVGNPGTITGPIGNALRLDGNDYVVVADDATLNPCSAITLSAWIRPNAAGTQYVIKKADIHSIDGYELSLSSSGKVFVRFNQKTSGNAFRVDSISGYPKSGNAWMHIAATYDGTAIRLYINGVLESSHATSFQIAANSLPLHLGAGNNGTRAITGAIDDARIYDRALGAIEIQQLASRPDLDR